MAPWLPHERGAVPRSPSVTLDLGNPVPAAGYGYVRQLETNGGSVVPSTLSEWTVEAILDLLIAGIHESEEFDFKESVPHAKDDSAKDRLRKSCAAFANSGGGFLVFGLADDRSMSPQDRFVGMDPTLDFPARFGDYPRYCAPSVYWRFRNPPLPVTSGRVIHVVEIPRSAKSPHAVGDANQGWMFPKRTNKGTEGMTIEEIRGAFLGFYEKRLRLQLLDAELSALEESAAAAYISNPEDVESKYSLVTLDIQTIESVVADTYPLTAGHTDLFLTLRELRLAVVVANNKARIFFSVAGLTFTDQKQMNREHNEFMANACQRVVGLAKKARSLLQPVLKV